MNPSVISKERVETLKKKYYLSLNRKLKNLKISEEFYGPTPPYLLVGAYNYPKVRIGSMLSLSNPEYSANPSKLYGQSYDRIITQFGMNMLGTDKTYIKNPINDDITDSILSYKPVSLEVKFKKMPTLNPQFSVYTIPTGYSAPVKKVKLVDNPKIPRITYNIINDDIKAQDAILKITMKTDMYYTMRLLSAGVLGKENNKRLVPTKWAITAVDDILTKQYLKIIKDYKWIDNYEVYTNKFLHNRFVILLIPGPWEYEQYEAWPTESPWGTSWGFNHEYEPFKGRKKYAEIQAGGYYAARYGVVEHLYLRKRQAKAIVFREIDEEYSIPVGVWQVRENVRNAMQKQPIKFNKLSEALDYIRPLLKIKLNEYMKKNIILKQKTLFEF